MMTMDCLRSPGHPLFYVAARKEGKNIVIIVIIVTLAATSAALSAFPPSAGPGW
jgi:hypothetical protein